MLAKIEHKTPGVTEIILNRPEKRNALSIELMTQLCQAIEEANHDPSQRVLIFRGEGPVFCAGLDLKEVQDPQKTEQSTQMVAHMLKAVYTTPLVTIAAVHGAALAGGAGLMSACDYVLAAENTQFGYPEIRRGLVAAQVMTFLLRQLPQRAARELLLFGEMIDAEKALTIGLINCVVSAKELLAEAYRKAAVALKGGPKAIAQTKHLIDELSPGSISEEIEKALHYHYEMRLSEEAKEGVKAFLEKRQPNWVER